MPLVWLLLLLTATWFDQLQCVRATGLPKVSVADQGAERDAQSAERDTLIQLYRATNGLVWTHSDNWNTSAPVCDWYGVNCDEDEAVTQLTLPENNLDGFLPTALSNLTKLKLLDVSQSAISGTLPREYSLWTSIEQV